MIGRIPPGGHRRIKVTPDPYVDAFAPIRAEMKAEKEKAEAEAKAAAEKAEAEEKKRQAAMAKAAREIAAPETSSLFDSDYQVASKMAEYLRDNLDEMSKTPEGIMEFERLSDQLVSFVNSGEEYYKRYYGTSEDDETGDTWMSAYKRMNDPMNPYEKEGKRDVNDRGHYEKTLEDLDRNDRYDFEVVNGEFVIKDGENSSKISAFQRSKDPFAAKLDFTDPVGPKDWYVLNMPKNIESKEQASDTAGALVRNNEKAQLDAARIYAEENDLNYEDVMKNPAQMKEAIDDYVEGIAESWKPKQAKPKSGSKPKTTPLDFVMSDSSFKSNENTRVVSDEAGNSTYIFEKSSIMTWPTAKSVAVSVEGDDAKKISSISFDGANYILVLSDGTEINVNKKTASGGKVEDNQNYLDIARQVDANLGEDGAFDSIIRKLYSKQQEKASFEISPS